MNNRKKETVTIYSYANTTDDWGRPRQGTTTTRNVEMILAIYAQRQVQDIRYNEVELIGLTDDRSITDANQIEINSIKYNVLHVIPSDRKYQILMKKV